MHNIYYSPEHFTCEVVFELEKQPDYDFDKIVVWRHLETGEFRWSSDSGCSCPSPFEDISSFEQLFKLPETLADLRSAVSEFAKEPNDWQFQNYPKATERQEFLSRVGKALGG